MDLKKSTEYEGIGVHDPYTGEARRIYHPGKKAPPLKNHPIQILDVSTPMIMTGGQVPSQDTTIETIPTKKQTSEQLMLTPYQNTTSSVRDFLAKISQLLESGQDLKVLEAHYSMRYAESLGLKDLAIYSLRMSRDSYQPMTEKHFSPFSDAWMNWGMTVNGRCLTARISESLKTGKGCSLSDILEENPDPKYFLSEKQTQHITKVMDGKAKYHQQDKVYNPKTDKPNLPAGTHGSTPHLMKVYQGGQ